MWKVCVLFPALATLGYKLNELRKEEEKKRQSKPRITDIRIYPIKSCHGLSLQHGKITELGFEYDRTWMVVDEQTNRFITQRQISKMATIIPSFRSDQLWVDAPGMSTLKFSLQTTKRADKTVQVWDDVVKAIDMGDECANWFSFFLERKVRLVRVDPQEKRIADATFWTKEIPGSKTISFADGFPFLLFSKESLQFVNDNISTNKIPLTRFRPNIVVEGVNAPFAEDSWKTFHIRSVTFHAIKPCERCKITTIDQETGEVTGKEPLSTLMKSRKFDHIKTGTTPAIFGQNISHESTGYIRVGDYVDVESK